MYTNEYYRTQFSANIDALTKLIQDVEPSLINSVPAPGKWCIGEVIDHLLIAGGKYADVLEAKIQENPDVLPNGSGPYSHPFLIRQFIKIVSPEYKRKMPTIAPFEPNDYKNFDKDSLLRDFIKMNERYIALIDLADKNQLHLGKIKVGNPVYPIWKMNISGCLAINEAHQRRHFGQIERILAAVNQ